MEIPMDVGRRPVTVRVARWSATHPWRAIALWLVFVVACVVVGGAVGARTATYEDLGVGESGRATSMVDRSGLARPATENVLVSGSTQAELRAVAEEVAERMRALPEVAAVGEPMPAADGTAVLLPVTMRGDPQTAADRIDPLLAATAAVQQAHPQLRVEQVGDASVNKGINDLVAEDLGRAELLSLPLTLAIMVVVFGAVIAAGVPVLLALSAVAAAVGLSTLASHVFPDTGTVNSVILLMGMAVGVDYSLFYLKREREERARGLGHIDAIEIAAATSGRSVVVSAIAVVVSMGGLYLAGDAIFASLATGSIIVVAVAMLGSLTVLPALLGKLGRWVDRPRVPLLWRLTQVRPGHVPRL
jgi:putative drug exporter of the RND superfamily